MKIPPGQTQSDVPAPGVLRLSHPASPSAALSSGVDAKTLSGILGHTKASFTLDTYTHVTGEMQRNAADIVGGFLTELLGERMEPWQRSENVEMAAST